APLLEEPLLLDLTAGLLLLQRPLTLEIELALLLGAARGGGLLGLPLVGRAVHHHIAGQSADTGADQHAGDAVAEDEPAGTGADRQAGEAVAEEEPAGPGADRGPARGADAGRAGLGPALAGRECEGADERQAGHAAALEMVTHGSAPSKLGCGTRQHLVEGQI